MSGMIDASLVRCREIMSDLHVSPEVARAAFYSLREDEMDPLGLRTFRMNLYAIYGRTLPTSDIDRIASEALRLKLWLGWDHHSHIEHMAADNSLPRIANLPIEQIQSLRRDHGGVMLASFQFGAIRDIFAGIAVSGIPITFALARSVHDEYCRSRASNPTAAIWRFADVADAESVEGIAKLGRALERGETILVCLDGNTGINGAHNLKGRLKIDFLGQNAHVKAGAARIAARHGVPIVPVLAPVGRRGARCYRIGSPIVPSGRLSGADAKEFAARATITVYRRLERYVRRFPAQWGVVESFHRWREPHPTSCNVTNEAILQRLNDGISIRIEPNAIVVSAVKNDEALVTNVHSLKSVRVPSRFLPLISTLNTEAIDLPRKTQIDRANGFSCAGLIAALGALGVLSFQQAGAGHAERA